MLLLLFAGVFLFVGLFFGLTTLAILVPGLFKFIVRFLPFIFHFAFTFVQFLWQMFVTVACILYSMAICVAPLVMEVMPGVTHAISNVFTWTTEAANAFLGFIYTAEQHAAVVGGVVIATVYYYINNIWEVLNGFEQQNNQNNHARPVPQRRNQLYPDLPDLYQDSINENENNANQQNEVDRDTIENENERNRAAETHRTNGTNRRLYPSLPTETYSYNDDAARYDDNRLCVVCFERPRDTVLFPCGHTQFCQGCTISIRQRNNLCPICQGRVVEHRHVFV